jgi:hypothetical protein
MSQRRMNFIRQVKSLFSMTCTLNCVLNHLAVQMSPDCIYTGLPKPNGSKLVTDLQKPAVHLFQDLNSNLAS